MQPEDTARLFSSSIFPAKRFPTSLTCAVGRWYRTCSLLRRIANLSSGRAFQRMPPETQKQRWAPGEDRDAFLRIFTHPTLSQPVEPPDNNAKHH